MSGCQPGRKLVSGRPPTRSPRRLDTEPPGDQGRKATSAPWEHGSRVAGSPGSLFAGFLDIKGAWQLGRYATSIPGSLDRFGPWEPGALIAMVDRSARPLWDLGILSGHRPWEPGGQGTCSLLVAWSHETSRDRESRSATLPGRQWTLGSVRHWCRGSWVPMNLLDWGPRDQGPLGYHDRGARVPACLGNHVPGGQGREAAGHRCPKSRGNLRPWRDLGRAVGQGGVSPGRGIRPGRA